MSFSRQYVYLMGTISGMGSAGFGCWERFVVGPWAGHCSLGELLKMDIRRRNKKKYVRITWDDKSRGTSHYVPLSSIPGHAHIKPNSRVSVKYGKTVWTGTICPSRKVAAAESLLGGKIDLPIYWMTTSNHRRRNAGHCGPYIFYINEMGIARKELYQRLATPPPP